jgi:hypothetical protein
MSTTGTLVQFSKRRNGANLLDVMPIQFPDDEELLPERITTSVRFRHEDYEHLEFLARLWNEGDRARGLRRRRKWKVSSVIDRLVRAQLKTTSEQMGGWPESKSEADDVIRRAVAAITKERREK